MSRSTNALPRSASRRDVLKWAGALGALLASAPAWADGTVTLPLPGGPDERSLTTAFPQKGPMILQRTRPPLLETPAGGVRPGRVHAE
ncbi:MAG: twin-arginine translocation signal domain-containing protein [Acetobacteraceae bacterium]